MAVTSKYRAGKKTIFGRTKHWKKRKYLVLPSSPLFDFVAIQQEEPVKLILVKDVPSMAIGKMLIKRFLEKPQLPLSKWYSQVIEVKIKGSSEVLSAEV